MKFLVVVPDLNVGGVTSSAKNFCKECAIQGNEIDILVMNNVTANISGVDQTQIDGISRYWNIGIGEFKASPLIKKIGLTPLVITKKLLNKRGLWLPLILNKQLTKEYDLVVAYRQCAPCYYFVLNCVKARRKIAVIHGDITFMGDISSWSRFLPQFDKIACVSNAVTFGFKNRFSSISDNFTTIYNMYDIESMTKLKSAENQFSVDSSKFNIISVCRHENGHKKVNRVIEACAILERRGFRDFHWYIVGDGPDFQYNIELAHKLGVSHFITFCGALENPFSLLSKCDISVMTSATEAYGMSLKESLILGVPVVAMEYPALSEVISNNKDGLICRQDIEDLCDKIMYLSSNAGILLQMRDYIARHPQSNEIAYKQLLGCL